MNPIVYRRPYYSISKSALDIALIRQTAPTQNASSFRSSSAAR
jgi:hypothetical protein